MFDMPTAKFYQSKWFIIFLILIIVFFLYQIWQDYYQQHDLRQEIIHLEDQLLSVTEEQQALAETMAYVQSDDFVEIEARTKLNLRKPGEQIIIVSNDDDIQRLMEQSGTNGSYFNQEEQSNLRRWWSHFWP
ncbi:MAG: hypothetical protein AUJ28_01495 [Parcubacteria group bacterium CG1_02_37_51]|uniref:Septum formation initiator n=2 Tax=Candidatus Komeiliibacteriota TaxID=1817908 RepID=A0A2M8DQG9_9BACT|nr:MAG: hypothetical protein AUJ28_01495 [Parcubacteria group bacterium CG1_02_37_51]PIY94750.1 MAG: hypothetical protein COY67_02095 [Candidatus Komeilibacteria bacterium CG_4_10_14_0_8_um_filter_37_78]PJC01356.1 MAG: hypothetical protein CO073_03760 [Candidatus Komeilibacteria bacterium CG_4_9_14_0_8_um_filter_36_9]